MSTANLISFAEKRIAERLQEQESLSPYIGQITSQDDFLDEMRPSLPSSYILPAVYLCVEKMSGIAYQTIGFQPQHIRIDLDILILDEDRYSYQSELQSKNFAQMLYLEGSIREALVGTCPSAEFSPIHLENSSFLERRDNLKIWKQTYRTEFYQH